MKNHKTGTIILDSDTSGDIIKDNLDLSDINSCSLYKDEDSVFFYDAHADITLYANTEKVGPMEFLRAMDLLCDVDLDVPNGMIEVKQDGVILNNKFIPISYLKEMAKGASPESLNLIGPILCN